ncbi:MAG TPA: DUF6788 family protein [bacterium]|nr:DUF6788 family protein [bacterium]
MNGHTRWVQDLMRAADQMLWGSLVAVYRKCGKPTCHCATGEKHGPAWYLSQYEQGRTRMRFVPAEQLDAVRRGVEAFHQYRALGQRVAAQNLERLLGPQPRRRRSKR